VQTATASIHTERQGESRRFPAPTEEQVLRIGQEAVVNAVCHGAPQNVAVELDYEDARLTLRVLDDGRGFDTPPSRERQQALRVDQHARARRGRRRNAHRAQHRRAGHRIEATVPSPNA
jgi:signal transduction histidine kinase